MSSPRFEASRILGERLRNRRRELRISQVDVANLSQVDLANYGRVERGVGNPTLVTILQLAVTLEVDPGELLQGLDDMELLPEHEHTFSSSDFVREQLALRDRPDRKS
jgi:transcriptional regulator with XRE-family HTH domain